MKNILVGVTGSVAAYKTPDLLRRLIEAGFKVKTVVTDCATKFVTPLALKAASGSTVHQMFVDVNNDSAMEHITLAKWADIILIAPASANCMAKLSYGFCDDLLSTICVATTAPVVLAPAMNQAMWANSVTQHNVTLLKQCGVKILEPVHGLQACGDIGVGRMLEVEEIVDYVLNLQQPGILAGKSILITAGSTREAIDPVRFITNRSSGKMGYALAYAAANLGATVTLITGPTALTVPDNCHKVISVVTSKEMLASVKQEIVAQDVFISAAAVGDYHVVMPALQKIKHDKTTNLTLQLKANTDILATVAATYDVVTVGFAAETENLLANAQAKFKAKGIDMLVANDVSDPQIGFDSDENAVYVITDKKTVKLERAAKSALAKEILQLMHTLL